MGNILFGLFGLSFLISKSGFTIFYSLSLVYGLYQFDWKSLKLRPLLEKWLLLLFPLAVIVSLFSLSGHEAAFDVLTRWTWPLVYFPVVYLQKNSGARNIFFKTLSLSLFIACGYSFFIFFRDHNFDYTFLTRVESFWDILRWGYFCAVALTILFSLLIQPRLLDNRTRAWLAVLFIMTVSVLIFNNTRGAWFGALLGCLTALMVQRKTWKSYLGYGLCVGLILAGSETVREKLLSSVLLEKKDSVTTESKTGRLNMWKVSWELSHQVPFFGVGFQHSQAALKDFLALKDPAYVQKYTGPGYSYNDQHSSYMTTLLQFGGIYFVILYGFLLLVLYQTRRDPIYWPALICTFVIYFFHSGIVSFEALVLFGLCSFALLQTSKVNSG